MDELQKQVLAEKENVEIALENPRCSSQTPQRNSSKPRMSGM